MSEKIPTAFGMVTPAPPTSFVPNEWFVGLRQDMSKRHQRMIRSAYIMQGIDPDNRPTISVKEPLSAEFLTARAEFAERWEAIIQEGEDKGFLDLGPDGDRWVTTDTDRWASVPNPDYDPDKPNPYARDLAEGNTVTVTIPARQAHNVIITSGTPE